MSHRDKIKYDVPSVVETRKLLDTDRTNKIDIQGLIQEGLALLRANMASHPSFDPNRPYEEKNAYFVELAQRGEQLFWGGLHWVAELYFKTLLREILNYEHQNHKRFNKGMVYANLGIAQMAIGKLDAGIANLLMADEEDRPFVSEPHGILNTRLWEQFEQPIIVDYLTGFNSNSDASLNFLVDKAFIKKLFVEMDLQNRVFLEGTIWTLKDNLQLNDLVPNVYTWGRLYSGLKDLCLLTEALLRKKQIADATIKSGSQCMLAKLLNNALSNQNIGYPQSGLNANANSLQEFVNNLEAILNNAKSPEIRRTYCLLIVRNFTGHHFDLSEKIISPSGKSFFDMYAPSLTNILSAVLYFKHINVI
ncbi:MAG: hypothetical protein V2A78_12125 [bacterium]